MHSRSSRTALTQEGLGVYDTMHPAYTIFNKEKKPFPLSGRRFKRNTGIFCGPMNPTRRPMLLLPTILPSRTGPKIPLTFPLYPGRPLLLFICTSREREPIFSPFLPLGKPLKMAENEMLPLAIQVHHAVCDGYHVGRFIEVLQEKIRDFGEKQRGDRRKAHDSE